MPIQLIIKRTVEYVKANPEKANLRLPLRLVQD